MPVLTGTISDVVGSVLVAGQVRRAFVRAPAARPSLASGDRLIVPDPVPVDAAGPVSLELEPGPAVLVVDTFAGGPSIYELYVTADMTLLAEAVAEAAPAHERSWVESVMLLLRAEAVDAAGAAADDRVQTGLDRVAAAGSASDAADSAVSASSSAGAAAGSASAAATSAGAAAVSASAASLSAEAAADAASGVPAALAGKADLVDGLVPESQLPELGAPGVVVTGAPDDPRDAPTAGDNAVAVGYGANAGDRASAVGAGSESSGSGAAAIGYSANAGGDASSAIGYSANAGGDASSAIGCSANAGGSYSAAIGYAAKAPNHFQITIGAHFPGEDGDPTYQHEVHVPGVLVLYSPDRNMWAITVDNTGTISAAPWTPPNISPM